MKRKLKQILASTKPVKKDISFSPEEIVGFLKKVVELQGINISLSDSGDDYVQFTIGDTIYTVLEEDDNNFL